jgi:lipopolysaccharide export system protein LptC
MIPVNRDTLMIIAAVVCLAGIIFLFKEVNKTKQEVERMKDFSEYVTKRLETPAPAPAPVPAITEKVEKVAE